MRKIENFLVLYKPVHTLVPDFVTFEHSNLNAEKAMNS